MHALQRSTTTHSRLYPARRVDEPKEVGFTWAQAGQDTDCGMEGDDATVLRHKLALLSVRVEENQARTKLQEELASAKHEIAPKEMALKVLQLEAALKHEQAQAVSALKLEHAQAEKRLESELIALREQLGSARLEISALRVQLAQQVRPNVS